MELDVDKITTSGNKIDRKPNKYSLSQKKITIASEAYPNPIRDGYSFNGWVKVDSLEDIPSKIPENPDYIKNTYSITDKDKLEGNNLILIASWSKNAFKTDASKNIYDAGNLGEIKAEALYFSKDSPNVGLSNSLMYSLSKSESEKKEEFITITLDNNITGELIIESSNALVYEDTKKTRYLSKLKLDGTTKTFYIFPKNIEEEKGLGAFSIKLGNKRVLNNSIIISGEWYPTYKHIKTNEIQLDSITGKKMKFTESSKSLAEYFNVGNSIILKNTATGIDNTDKTGRNLLNYKVDKTQAVLPLGDNVKPTVTDLGLPNEDYNVILTPVYKCKEYSISYTDKENKGYKFKDDIVFPISYTVDTPKELNNGINKYYEQKEDSSWIVTSNPEKGNHLTNGVFIKSTDVLNTYENWKENGYKNLNVKLEVLEVINYTNYNGNKIADESDVELNPIKEAAKVEAISDKSSSEIGYIRKESNQKIELSAPQDIPNYSFIGFYEPISKTKISSPDERGKYIYNITGTEGNNLEFYSMWDNDVNGFTVTLDSGINCSVTAEDSNIEKFEVQ